MIVLIMDGVFNFLVSLLPLPSKSSGIRNGRFHTDTYDSKYIGGLSKVHSLFYALHTLTIHYLTDLEYWWSERLVEGYTGLINLK